MTELKNPGLHAEVPFDTVVYASSGLNYSAVPALAQYNLFDTPDPAYVTGRIDISAFAHLGSAPWPFANTNVPLNGQLCVPRGRGTFPLAVFAHGNQLEMGSSAASGHFWWIILVFALGASSCALPLHSDHATTHYVIVGFGVVTVHENSHDAIVATDTQSLGLTVTNRPDFHMSAGYLSSAVVSVPDNAEDIRVEASRRPFGPLIVDTASAKLQPPSKGDQK